MARLGDYNEAGECQWRIRRIWDYLTDDVIPRYLLQVRHSEVVERQQCLRAAATEIAHSWCLTALWETWHLINLDLMPSFTASYGNCQAHADVGITGSTSLLYEAFPSQDKGDKVQKICERPLAHC